MPELPEVELVARALDGLTKGRRIHAVEVSRPRLIPHSSPDEFARAIEGARIARVGRRGKHLLFNFDRPVVMLTHLRMTGRFLLLPREAPLPKFTHAVFHLDDGTRLAFSDQRHFGMMRTIAAGELATVRELRALAPEPFSTEFTPQYLAAALARSRRTLKETLLDQTKVTGLGNIYAAEVMFVARCNPFNAASSLSRRRVPRLHHAILDVLRESLDHGSTLNVDPQNIDGSYYGGAYEGRWRVYGREGEACSDCGAKIRRLAHAGRSTYFCPRCQRS